jgi:hypothetical protein
MKGVSSRKYNIAPPSGRERREVEAGTELESDREYKVKEGR